MKANITRGGGFRGALNYVFDVGPEATHEKNAELVGGNMSGDNPLSLAREFAVVRQLRPDIKKPVWHASLALPKNERLSTEKWREVAHDFMVHMGFDLDKTPYVVVRHNDTEHDHVHIIASRSALDGSVWLGQWEARRAIEVTQELEKLHGLVITPGLGDVRAERKKSSRNEIKMAARKEQEPPRERLQRLIDAAAKGKPTALEFAQRLETEGVNVRANLASTGRMNGFSFEIGGIHFKGQDLGDAYKWNGLQKRGVTYDKERDSAGLERFRAAAAVRQVQGGDDAPGLEHDPRRDLWRAYQAWNQDRVQRLAEQSAAQRESEKARRAAIKDSFAARRAQLNAQRSAGNAAQIRGHLSIARMERATQEVALREQIDRERAELKAAKNKPYTERYLDFLAERAQTGDELTLAELRRMQRDKPRPIEGKATVRPIEDGPPAERDPFHSDVALSHVVHVNGDVTYSRGEEKIIVDRGREVIMLQMDDKTIETCMRFAIAKFGAVVNVNGTDEQKRRIAEVAATTNTHVTFADEAMNKIVADRRAQSAQERFNAWRDRQGKKGTSNRPADQQANTMERNVNTTQNRMHEQTDAAQQREAELRDEKADDHAELMQRRAADEAQAQEQASQKATRERENAALEAVERKRKELAERNKSTTPNAWQQAAGALSPNATHQKRSAAYADAQIKRGISTETLDEAEQQGIFEVDEQGLRTFKSSTGDGPAVLRGNDNEVQVVDNGVDALALRDISKREGREPPTTIIAGEGYKGKLADSPEARDLLKNADSVTVWRDNAKDDPVRAARHEQSVADVVAARGKVVSAKSATRR